MHTEEEYSRLAHIIREITTNWQPHKMLKIATPTFKFKAFQSGMKKACMFVKAQFDGPTVNFQP